jgi:hypothetical protein
MPAVNCWFLAALGVAISGITVAFAIVPMALATAPAIRTGQDLLRR